MVRHHVKPFDPTKPLVANKTFKFQGKQYAPGQKFDLKHMACSDRKARQLYEGRFLRMADAKADKGSTKKKSSKKTSAKKHPKKVVEQPVETPVEEAVTEPDVSELFETTDTPADEPESVTDNPVEDDAFKLDE